MGDDIRVRKLARYFDDLDSDDDGFLEEADFAQAAERYIAALGLDPDSLWAAELTDQCLTMWQEYLGQADTDGDGQVGRQKLASAFAQLSEADAATQIAATADAYFQIMDADGDGLAGEDEFVRLLTTAARMSEDESEAAYARLDPAGVGFLSRDQFQQAMRDFFFSDDPQAPGNLLFGKY